MDKIKELLKKLEDNFLKEEKAIEKGEWDRVEKIINENNKIVKKMEKTDLTNEDEILLMELFKKGKEIEKRIEEKIELLKKKIAVTQNISKNLNNLFTQTEEPSLFIDEKK